MCNFTDSVRGALGDPGKPSQPTKQYDLYEEDDPWWAKSYKGNHKGSSYYSGGTHRGVGYTLAATKKVVVVGADGSEEVYTVPYGDSKWFDFAKEHYPVKDDSVRIPVENCEFTYNDPTFNACVYTATNDYMQARWGRRLDDSDRRWLAAHPLSTDGGVPQEYTATCINQLVAPYGMRVSRVRFRRGSLVMGDNNMGWLQALGCNPFALADRSTSNAEAAERMGMDISVADSLWRVDFGDEPLPCSIVGERGWSSGSGVNVGSMGGHARYLAPRARGNDWFISVQLDHDDRVSHLVPAPDPEYVPRKGARVLLLSSVTSSAGKPIAEKVSGTWRTPGSASTAVASSHVLQYPVYEPATVKHDPLTDVNDDIPQDIYQIDDNCMICGTSTDIDEFASDNGVCFDCLDFAWEEYSCPHCRADFRVVGAPLPVAFDVDNYDWECSECKGVVTVPAVADPTANERDQHLSDISFAVFYNHHETIT